MNNLKKLIYISSPPFFDFDLSLIKSISKIYDVYYILDLPSYYLNSSAISIEKHIQSTELLPFESYREFQQFNEFFSNSHAFVANRHKNNSFHFENIRFQHKLCKFVNGIKPDIIHYNNYAHLTYFKLLFSKKYPKIITIHDPFTHIGDESLRNSMNRFINFRIADKIVILNKTQEKKFIQQTKLKPENILTSSLGPYEYLTSYLNKTKTDVDNGTTKIHNILFVGRITPYKGVDYLLRAFKKLQLSNIRLIIAGSGSFNFSVDEYKTDNRITFINRYITNTEIANLIQSSSFVVCPYIEATQSGVIMSAFGLKKPVIATNVGGLPEMVENNITGLIVDAEDEIALSKAITELILNEDLLQTMSQNIESIYFENGSKSWNAIASQYDSTYQNLLNQKHK